MIAKNRQSLAGEIQLFKVCSIDSLDFQHSIGTYVKEGRGEEFSICESTHRKYLKNCLQIQVFPR
jgi:hypothetical protein